ncbi:hypothetical protein TNIN_239941, partial [Trichonephila inaurata madagascariensis]
MFRDLCERQTRKASINAPFLLLLGVRFDMVSWSRKPDSYIWVACDSALFIHG